MSDDNDDGGDDDDDDEDDDDNGDWYFGLKGRRSRSPGQRPGYWWTTVMFALKGHKLLQGVLATHRIYLGRCPGLEALWPVRPFFLWDLRSLRPYISYELKNNLHPTPAPCNVLKSSGIHRCRLLTPPYTHVSY